eukprot:6208961-Pleurochrysis_carterae.AAC.3
MSQVIKRQNYVFSSPRFRAGCVNGNSPSWRKERRRQAAAATGAAAAPHGGRGEAGALAPRLPQPAPEHRTERGAMDGREGGT